MLDTAIDYLQSGLCVLPAILDEKRPALTGWKQYQRRLPTERQVRSWFDGSPPMSVLTGAVSGNLEMLDFDYEAELFERWCELVASQSPGLVDRLVIERSQSGGRHVVYRCTVEIPGNRKLAQRIIRVDSSDPIVIGGKKHIPRKVGERFELTCTLIETRGEGGLFLCDPTPDYKLIQGSLRAIPILSEAERSVLIEAACALNEALPPDTYAPIGTADLGRPGDEFNERGDVRELLIRHGWTLAKAGDNEYWRRPGKEQGWSASLKAGVLYVFSSNAAPFESQRAYSPFSVYTLLDHGGDFAAASSALRNEGFGQHSDITDVDLSGMLCDRYDNDEEPHNPAPDDPGPMPDELLHVPGFISEVMAFCLETAPYPNEVMAFCGALTLQAFLAGRKVRDPGDNRTNLYLLGLAHSAAGKDWPRKVNIRVLHEVGLADCLGERFASGEGIQDALFLSPSMLFQTDEIDGLLQSINKSRDARHENIMSTLLTMYSSANSVFPMRRKAGKESPGVINQPSLVIFGTAIPNHYYEALSERMLTNGFFARMLILECGRRGAGQEPQIRDLPPRILEAASWWRDFQSGGNLGNHHPIPAVVSHTPEARSVLVDARHMAEAEYERAESLDDAVGTTVWGRVSEQVRKLALLYAVSENHQTPEIGRRAAEWAVAFVMHQTRRMLFMADGHVSRNEFDAMCKEMLRVLRDWKQKRGDDPMPEWELNRRLPWKPRDHEDVRMTLMNQKRIRYEIVPTKTQPRKLYRLLEE